MKLTFTLLFVFFVVNLALAQPGSLDPTFGNGGKVLTSFGPGNCSGSSIAVQADGKILVAGSYSGSVALVKYNTDGSLDLSFNGTGRVVTSIPSRFSYASEMVLQRDGKIVVAGGVFDATGGDFLLIRYNADGSLDLTFNSTGMVTTSFGPFEDYALAVALQSDGKIVAAGVANNARDRDFAAARYNTDGSLDLGFNGTGKIVTTFYTYSYEEVTGLAVQPDGKIVLAGQSQEIAYYSFALARFNTDGSYDMSFDGDGKLMTPTSYNEEIRDITIQPDSKIVVCGARIIPEGVGFALNRYNTDGSLDNTFDGDGKVHTLPGLGRAIAIQNDGKIVAAGIAGGSQGYDFILFRYKTDGSIDMSFGPGGTVRTSFSAGDDACSAMKLFSNRIYVVGYSSADGINYNIALAAYKNDALPLPLYLISFDAVINGTSVVCKWQTEDELNTSHFNVERSNDGINFISTGKVYALGASTRQPYNFTDNLPAGNLQGSNIYYRLQVNDKDGKFTYSPIVNIAIKNKHQFTVWPNPASSYLYVKGDGLQHVEIVDNTGKLVFSKKSRAGNPIDVSQLAKGMFTIKLTNKQKEVQIEKILIR